MTNYKINLHADGIKLSSVECVSFDEMLTMAETMKAAAQIEQPAAFIVAQYQNRDARNSSGWSHGGVL